jgi:hypothetical protein
MREGFLPPERTAMRYFEYKAGIQHYLERHSVGVSWQELRESLKLPYVRPCPEWTRRLEVEIGLVRQKGAGRSLLWTLHGRGGTIASRIIAKG